MNRLAFLAVAAGMVVWGGPECRAETIGINIAVTLANGSINLVLVDTFTTGGTSTNYGTVNLTTLNAAMTAAGSHYQFSALGGTSNWSGAASGGTLSLTGTIFLPAGATPDPNPVNIFENEFGFTIPSSGSGTLFSSSGATFTGAASTSSNGVFGGFNAITFTPRYAVTPSSTTGSQSTTIASFTTPYGLNNGIGISLTGSTASPQGASGVPQVTDAFSATATLKGPASSVPEPAGWVLVLSGLSLLGIARWRCRPAAPAV
jgi:hypothetical protein